jgi:hypothetical protein
VSPLTAPAPRVLLLIAATLVCTILPPSLTAQSAPVLHLELSEGGGSVEARISNLLADAGLSRSLDAGLPVRLLLVTELWRDGWLDSQQGRHEWRASIRLDPLGDLYTVETGEGLIVQTRNPAEVSAALAGSIEVPLRPDEPGRYYYLGRLEIETLSLSDLDELRRWLRGDLAPAIGQDTDIGSAFGRGLRRLVVRVLGLPVQRIQARTPRFVWEE